jgi:hypothetical protein
LNPGDTVTVASGPGVVANTGGVLNASGTTITTTGANGVTILTIEANDVTVTAAGSNGFGAVAQGGQISILNSSVTTHGLGAVGLALLPNPPTGSTLSVTGSTVSTTGISAPGIFVRSQNSQGEHNIITLDNTKVTTQQSNGIETQSPANIDITLTNGSEVIPGNGVLFLSNSTGNRVTNLTGDGNVNLQGDVLV